MAWCILSLSLYILVVMRCFCELSVCLTATVAVKQATSPQKKNHCFKTSGQEVRNNQYELCCLFNIFATLLTCGSRELSSDT